MVPLKAKQIREVKKARAPVKNHINQRIPNKILIVKAELVLISSLDSSKPSKIKFIYYLNN